MRIEGNPSISAAAADPVSSLEQRLVAAQPPGPGFEDFYRQVLELAGAGGPAIVRFISGYRSSDEGRPDYHTLNEQVKVVGQVLARFKEEGLAGSAQEREMREVMTRLFGASLFISRYMQEVFQPPADDSWENADW
ncbi:MULTISPECIES: hypothetical protein [Pseudomonas]|uniref:Uncharacterized protein n=1 Tax=Pseudomonas asplenii TaxID=53407 RepID=A0A0M9GH49_9PSED|nr:hypothetical protein [Pseudomonas fuscovaginae]KPA90794.1 hypothetical protein PF66_02863 [Pseudomonas fuscovaginae]KPA96214.1 hypothetical protein PF70_03771 [Pseudomonas fuscovaginae]